MVILVFPGISAGKKISTCNTGDPSSIPGPGRSPGEGIGYPLQYSWASLMVQMVKNPLAMQETWVWSLGLEDPMEGGIATHSSILAWRICMDRGDWQATVHGITKNWTWLTTAWEGVNLSSSFNILATALNIKLMRCFTLSLQIMLCILHLHLCQFGLSSF